MEVLQGAIQTLKQSQPILFIEIEERHGGTGHFVRVNKYLENLGFKGFFLYRGELLSTEKFDIEQYQKLENADKAGIDNLYINNFIYLPVNHAKEKT